MRWVPSTRMLAIGSPVKMLSAARAAKLAMATRIRVRRAPSSSVVSPFPCARASLQVLGDQAHQVVASGKQEEGEDDCQADAEPPFLCLRAERSPPHRFDRVEDQMTAVEHRDREKIDEPEIDRQQRRQADGGEHTDAGDLAQQLGDLDDAAQFLDRPAAVDDLPERPAACRW